MTYSKYDKAFNQLETKPAKMTKYLKHNKPKDRKTGINLKRCGRCGRTRAHIDKYGLNLCRQCFREIATKIGFKKYS
jgi:small subunit ribosomal protein S14